MILSQYKHHCPINLYIFMLQLCCCCYFRQFWKGRILSLIAVQCVSAEITKLYAFRPRRWVIQINQAQSKYHCGKPWVFCWRTLSDLSLWTASITPLAIISRLPWGFQQGTPLSHLYKNIGNDEIFELLVSRVSCHCQKQSLFDN